MAEDKHEQKDDLDAAEVTDDQALADEWAAALEQQTDEEKEEGEEDEWAAAMAEAEAVETVAAADSDVRQAPMENFSEALGSIPGAPDLDVILDIPVIISMEVGNTQIAIRNLLQLNQGSVIELDRLAGEPLDVLVNGTLIAHGEVVMVNEKFGIRLTDVISPSERIKKLRG